MDNGEKIRNILNLIESANIAVEESYDDELDPEERYDAAVIKVRAGINNLLRLLPEVFDDASLEMHQEALQTMINHLG